MISKKKKQERILLVGVELQGMDNFDMSMEELSLAKTAGKNVQRAPTPKAGEIRYQDFLSAPKTKKKSLKWSKQMNYNGSGQ